MCVWHCRDCFLIDLLEKVGHAYTVMLGDHVALFNAADFLTRLVGVCYVQVFVWMGHQSKDATRRLTKDLATRYIQAAGRKHDCPVVEGEDLNRDVCGASVHSMQCDCCHSPCTALYSR